MKLHSPSSQIFLLTLDDEIKIHYGWYDTENGGAEAPDEVPTGGYSQFAIAVKGTLDDDDDAYFENIDGEDLMVRVRVQRSGGGMAAVSPMTVNAGDVMSAITVTYTADGQVDDGMLKLTIPANWDAPTMDNVTIVGGGANTAARYGGAHTAAELTALAAVATDDVDLGAMDVFVDNVMLAGGDTVTFTYTSAMAQGTTGSAVFAVAIDGGDGPDDFPDTGPKAVGGMTTVDSRRGRSRFRYGSGYDGWDCSPRFYGEYPYLHIHRRRRSFLPGGCPRRSD